MVTVTVTVAYSGVTKAGASDNRQLKLKCPAAHRASTFTVTTMLLSTYRPLCQICRHVLSANATLELTIWLQS